MNTHLKCLLFALTLFGCTRADVREQKVASEGPPSYEVHFSPHGGCERALVSHIDGAHQSVLVLAYSFTSRPITNALVRAKSRGVQVQVVLDRSNQNGVGYSELTQAQVPVRIDFKHAIAHNKVMIFDGQTVETGSFNYSNAAEANNAENCLFISDVKLASEYASNWQSHWEHATLAPIVPSN